MRYTFLLGAALACASASANAAFITLHVETSSARQSMIATDALAEDFSSTPSGNGFTSNFGGNGPTATFQGFSAESANSAGSAFGASAFATATSAAQVKLDRAVKYFGFRTDQLDGRNRIELFSHGESLGYFTLTGSAAAAGFSNDPAQQKGGFTYVNFFSDTAFDEVRFTPAAGRFSFDDVRVDQVTPVPEAGLWALMILGFGALGAALRFRAKRARLA